MITTLDNRSLQEKVLSVMPQGKPKRLSEIASLAGISDDYALKILQALEASGRVMPFNPDEELPGTFWRRV